MTTPPQPDAPAATVINWYFGPVAWDSRPEAMWHAQCPDPYATGHDGEVWLDHRQGAFCTGCRHYEEGQAEQEIPAERLAEIPPQPKPWEEPSPATPDPSGYLAATRAVMSGTTSTMPELPPEVETLDPTQDQPFTVTEAEPAPQATEEPAPPVAEATPPAGGLLRRIENVLTGHDGEQAAPAS